MGRQKKKKIQNERTSEFSRRARWNGGKQLIRYRVQSNDYKDTQQHEKRHRNHKREQSEIKNTISEINNTLEGINSRLDEAEDRISDWENKVERKHPGRAAKK